MKAIHDQNNWSLVAKELEAENLKLASYDQVLVPLLGNISGKSVMDYGCGPGVLALALKKLGAEVEAFDISPQMVALAGQKIGKENVRSKITEVKPDGFDHVICNLVLCIVPESEVKVISANIRKLLKNEGTAFIGFCNPLIFDVPESRLDFRQVTGLGYARNQVVKKIKKEGGYEISELHRPIEWYEEVFCSVGLKVVDKMFTPGYEIDGRMIEDFILFRVEVDHGIGQ